MITKREEHQLMSFRVLHLNIEYRFGYENHTETKVKVYKEHPQRMDFIMQIN